MTNKTLSHGVKLLKISTYLSGFIALVIILLVGFFVAFPALLKSPIEQNVSDFFEKDVSFRKITFDVNNMDVVFNIHGISINNQTTLQKLAQLDHLRFNVDLMNIFDDIYHPSDIYVDSLDIYSNQESKGVSVKDIQSMASVESLQAMNFFNSLTIDKTTIISDKYFEIGKTLLTRDKNQLTLKVFDQQIENKVVDISATISAIQLSDTGEAVIPLRVSNDSLSLLGNVRLYKDIDDYVEFEGFLPDMQALELADYVTKEVVGRSTNDWMQRGFKSGSINNLKLSLKKNLSKNSEIITSLDADLNSVDLKFNSQWQELKDMNAKLTTDGKYIEVMVRDTKLYDMPLNNIKVKIADMSKEKLDVEVIGKINTKSDRLIKFLQDMPLGETVDEVSKQFTLDGDVAGDLYLSIPLDDRESIVDVDLVVNNNRLTTLNGSVVVENYNSSIAFHDYQITSDGTGVIREDEYEIRINPHNRANDEKFDFAVELIGTKGLNTFITNRKAGMWGIQLDSKHIDGDIGVVLNDDNYPTVRILKLEIDDAKSLRGDLNIKPNDLPDMRLVSKNIVINGEKIPNFSAHLTTDGSVLAITDLIIDGIDIANQSLSFDGVWVDGRTRLMAAANGEALDEFLQGLGIEEKVKGGKFKFDIRLACECTPWNMDFENLTGYAELNVEKGEFTDKDPNIGRVFSLLNIDSISKRLKLDVDDLVNKGFVYDSIEAKLHLGDSLATINEFKLDSTSSDIELSGNSNYVEKTYNLEAKVIPEIAASVPAATYLAGGGLAGLGVWLADKVLFEGEMINKIVDEVVEFKYKITGDWDNPSIENISSIL